MSPRLLVLALLLGLAAPPDPLRPGPYRGRIELPGAALRIEVRLAREDGRWSGTIVIPAQGARDLPLEVEVENGEVEMRLVGVPGDPTFRGKVGEGILEGTFRQHGLSFPFRLEPGTLERVPRPQEPRPPLPYRVEEVTFGRRIRFAGTFTSPRGEGPFPAVFLVSGSGPQDRDETIAGHKPFLVLADRLTRAGLSVLRADDRGVGGSGGRRVEATTFDFALDALEAVDWLAHRPEVDPRRIGLIGHSEGGIVAPIASSLDERVRFLVLLAPPGVPGAELLVRQQRLLAEGLAFDEDRRRAYLDVSRRIVETAASPLEPGLREKVRELVAEQFRILDGGAPNEAAVAAAADPLLSPWFRFFLRFDPQTALRRVRVPVLALWGGLDRQVDPAQNLPPVAAALEQAGVEDRTLRILPRLNHLFQTAATGLPSEYGRIDETIAPAALEAIGEWIDERFGARKDG